MGFDSANANFIVELGLYPVLVPEQTQQGKDFKIPYEEWLQVIEYSKVKSLRYIAKDYGVSYEAVRRVLNAAISV